jgi:hypothetical protein
MEQVEEPCRSFGEVAGGAEVRVSANGPEPDQILIVRSIRDAEPQRLRRRVMARQLPRRFDLTAVDRFRVNLDGPPPE